MDDDSAAGRSERIEFLVEDGVDADPDGGDYRTFAPDVSLSTHPDLGQVVTIDDDPSEREYSGSFSIELDEPAAADLFGWLVDGEVCTRCGATYDGRDSLASHVEDAHGLQL